MESCNRCGKKLTHANRKVLTRYFVDIETNDLKPRNEYYCKSCCKIVLEEKLEACDF